MKDSFSTDMIIFCTKCKTSHPRRFQGRVPTSVLCPHCKTITWLEQTTAPRKESTVKKDGVQTMMLNENSQKWVYALRSGKYTRTAGILRCEGKAGCCNCALGVAMELYIDEHPETYTRNLDSYGVFVNPRHIINARLPSAVREWLGLTISGHDRVMDMNDNKGLTFEQMAEFIESNREVIFFK